MGLDFNELSGVSSKKKVKKTYTKKTRKRKGIESVEREGEPGINIGTAFYKQVSQLCERCKDLKTHFVNYKKKKIKCSYCGKLTSF